MHFYDILISIFKPFINDSPTASTSNGHSPSNGTSSETADQARKITDYAISGLRSLLVVYRTSTPDGFLTSPPYILHKLATVAFFDLAALASDSNARKSFITCLAGIKQLTKAWFIAKPVLRMIQLTAERLSIPLPEQAKEILAVFQEESWREIEVGKVKSQYPVDSFKSAMMSGLGSSSPPGSDGRRRGSIGDNEEGRLEELLNEWEGVEVKSTNFRNGERATNRSSVATSDSAQSY